MSDCQKIIFRVEESSIVGFGHMSRCRTLALAFALRGADVSFYCLCLRTTTRKYLEAIGIKVFDKITNEVFLNQDWTNSIVVVDGYQFDEIFWSRLIARNPKSTVCIDDFRKIRYSADYLICYNEGIHPEKFNLDANVRMFLGGKYLLLRQEILDAVTSFKRTKSRSALVIAAGGTRQEKWVSDMIIQAFKLDPHEKIWVLSGRSMTIAKVLRNTNIRRSQVKFFSNLDANEMIKLYLQANCLITPASTLMLEAFSVGCPIVTGWIANNQRNSLDFYAKKGLVVSVANLQKIPEDRLKFACLNAKFKRNKMILSQRKYIQNSNYGIKEIVDAILIQS
jgi:UDP-2,4-diacetamido-2,4,6-trideoxy-beta-L-altropyranose hydrolase